MSKVERDTMKNLKNRKEITITPADKGNTVVVLNTIDYEGECLDQLSDRSTYQTVSRDPTVAWENRTKVMVKSLHPTESDYTKFLIPVGSNCPRFYGLPKIHKDKNKNNRIPLRPVVAFINAPTYRAAKFTAGILNGLHVPSEHYTKNSTELRLELESKGLTDEALMVSFDVVSLYTSIPIDLAIQATVRMLTDKDANSLPGGITKEDVITLTTFCLNNSFFTFRGTYYKQVKGLAMGSPISSTIAEIVMHEIDIAAVGLLGNRLLLWKRYVDDILAFLNRLLDIQDILNILNGINTNIQFTVEEEKHNSIPFLDIKIRSSESGLKCEVYRKPTHSGHYLNFNSEHTYSQRMSVIRSLTYRVLTHCSTEESKEKEKDIIMRDMLSNDYPRNIINEEMEKTLMSVPKLNDSREEQPKTVSIPLINGLSQQVSRALRRAEIRTVMKPGLSLKNMICNFKDKVSKEDTSNCVYRVPCSECNASYVGETMRRFNSRLTEHKAAVRNGNHAYSALAEHAVNDLHPPDWEAASILEKEPNFRSRRFKEAVHILNQQNTLNRNEGINLPEVFIPLLTNDQISKQNKFGARKRGVFFHPNW
jgi:hypothetical protein